MNDDQTNPTGTNPTNPTEPKNLTERVGEKINDTAWNYMIWSLPDLAPLADAAKANAALAEKEAEQEGEVSKEELLSEILAETKSSIVTKPEIIPSTTFMDLDKDRLKDHFVFGKEERRYSFSFGLGYRGEDDEQKGTLARVMQVINQYPKTVEGDKVRSLINNAFGYAILDQKDLFEGDLHRRESYVNGNLNTIIKKLESEFDEEADVIPEEVKYLKKILDDDNFKRQSKTRISIDPYVVAMTTYAPSLDGSTNTQTKQVDENTYRTIIIGALLKQEDKIAQEDEASEEATKDKLEENTVWNKIHDEWNGREKTYFTADEAKLLIPRITMKEMAIVAKELGDNFQDHAYNAFQHYTRLRKDYMKMLTTKHYDPNKQEPEVPAVTTEPQGNGAEGELSWMDSGEDGEGNGTSEAEF